VNFIELFEEYTSNISSPAIFRKWGAISLIAGALERKVWVVTRGSPVYPNLFVILAANPGVGKSEITWRVRQHWGQIEGHHLASSSVTKASMMDELAEASRRWVTNDPQNPVDSFNSLKICVNELGVFITAYDNEFISTMTDLWDCKDYSETRRSSKKKDPIQLAKVQLNMLAAGTPSYLNHMLPEGAWDQGFMSRTIIVFSGEIIKKSLFGDHGVDQSMAEQVQAELDRKANLYGEMGFTEESKDLLNNFLYTVADETAPQHPRLMAYNVRRVVHLLKLCMVASVCRSDELVIRAEDYQVALDWLLEAEATMPEIFKAMSQGGAGQVMNDAWYYLVQLYAKENSPILIHRLIQFLQERIPAHSIQSTIEMMEKGKMIEQRLTPAGQAFIPLGKRGGNV